MHAISHLKKQFDKLLSLDSPFINAYLSYGHGLVTMTHLSPTRSRLEQFRPWLWPLGLITGYMRAQESLSDNKQTTQ